jgi:glycosyltransferase involved in cell wall biosynthesis
VCIKNTQNKTEILKKSLADELKIQSHIDKFCVVSLGRLDVVKQFEKIPEIVSKIKAKGKQISWYIFGEGGERKNIEDAIEKYEVADDVFLPGAIDNPYPAIRRADLVAITSSSESFCNVVTEAEIIGTRVICTPFPAVYDAMRNRATGVICPLDEFADQIVTIINETSLPADNKNKKADETYDETILGFITSLEELFCEK